MILQKHLKGKKYNLLWCLCEQVKLFGVKSNILNIVENEEKQFVMTQFHPSYTYEDFIEGVKPAD